MGLAILGVVALLFIVLAYLGARTWPAWHQVVLVFLFLGAMTLFVLAAATLKTQDRWRSQYETATKEIEVEERRNGELIHGSAENNLLGEVQLRGEVNRLLVDRGRVWRNLRLAELGDGVVLLDPTSWSDAGCKIGNAEETTEEAIEEEAAAAETPAEDAASAEGAAPAEGEAAAEGETPAEGEAAAEGEVPADGEATADGETTAEGETPAEGESPAESGEAAPAENPAGTPAATPAAAPVVAANAPGLEVGAVVYAFKQAPLSALAAPVRKVALTPPNLRPSTDAAGFGGDSEDGGEATDLGTDEATETPAEEGASEDSDADASSESADATQDATPATEATDEDTAAAEETATDEDAAAEESSTPAETDAEEGSSEDAPAEDADATEENSARSPAPMGPTTTMTVADEEGEAEGTEEAIDNEAAEEETTAADATAVEEETAAEAPADAEVAAEDEAANLIVQACPVPIFYMGEFRVVASPEGKAGAITLQPTSPLTEEQIKQLQDGNSSWVLYEVMPADDHETFAGLNAAQMQALIPPDGFRDQATYELSLIHI